MILGVGLLSGSALWLSFGHLDAGGVAGVAVRVAMLPPVGWWVVCVGLGVVAAAMSWWLASRARGDCSPVSDAGLDAVWPWASTGLLILPFLPFLPWLADWLPILTLLAGPGRWMLWFVVLVQVGIRIASRTRSWSSERLPARRAGVAVMLAGVLLSGTTAALHGGGLLYPSGDEPHYLVMMQSLWRDGDLRIENNHDRGDTREYFPRDLRPHYLTRGVDGEIYSVHPVGLPVLAAPVYAVGGYWWVVAMLILAAALAGLLVWRLAISHGMPRYAARPAP